MKRTDASISLGYELNELMSVLESAELLADMLESEGFPNAEAASRAPRMLAAVIGLVIGRVNLLRQVVIQQTDASVLLGRRNKRDGIDPGED